MNVEFFTTVAYYNYNEYLTPVIIIPKSMKRHILPMFPILGLVISAFCSCSKQPLPHVSEVRNKIREISAQQNQTFPLKKESFHVSEKDIQSYLHYKELNSLSHDLPFAVRSVEPLIDTESDTILYVVN